MPIVTILASLETLYLVIMERADTFASRIKLNILTHEIIHTDAVLNAFRNWTTGICFEVKAGSRENNLGFWRTFQYFINVALWHTFWIGKVLDLLADCRCQWLTCESDEMVTLACSLMNSQRQTHTRAWASDGFVLLWIKFNTFYL